MMPGGESEARAKTRARFDEVFKKYTDLPSERKKVKKRNPQPPESIVLQTLRKDLDLEKDTEDNETILQNTYHPDQRSPRFTKNKRREREVVEKVNLNNNGNQEDAQAPKGKRKSRRELPPLPQSSEDPVSHIIHIDQDDSAIIPQGSESQPGGEVNDVEQGPKRKSKKGRRKTDEEAESREVEAADELIQEYQQQIEQEEQETAVGENKSIPASQGVMLNNEVRKKKKKKLKPLDVERDASVASDLQQNQDEVTELRHRVEKTSNTRDQDEDGADSSQFKGKRKKKKKQVVKEESDAEVEEPRGSAFDDSLVLGVYIHRADRLKTSLLVSHPMVKIHVIDDITGQYVKKEDSHRPVSSFYEQENVDHILPIMTQPFDFKKNKSTIPEWEEQIVFNERFGYFLQDDDESPKVTLFFEILDFLTMEEARANVDVDKHEQGFRKIAWAFLKLVGTNGVLNIDSKLRLQLYCPPPRARRQPHIIEVVDWWRRYPRNRYPSTLYVTVKGLKLPDHVDPSIRSMMALQQERGSTSFSELQSEVTRRTTTHMMDSKPAVLKWSRVPGQACRVPNKPLLAFRGGQMGCFTLRFSHDGRTLAAACADQDAFPVIVYEIPSGKVLAAFSGHLSIVYDLCWSRDDHSLLSASSDGTVRMWDVNRLQGIARKVLPHPSFVYCAQYHPTAQHLVVTGGYDFLVRVWGVNVRDVNGVLLQELEGHQSFINALCFDSEGTRMFSADNAGHIIVWRTTVADSSHQQPCRRWLIEKEIGETDLRGIPINTLQVHPNGRRLLIHAKDSVVRVMDLRVLAVKKYSGATNYRERIHSTFTPCGNYIFSGSEDGMAYVWNAETGDQVAVYSELCYPTALRGVAFHPHENMVAFCAFGQSQPVHVYIYDRKVAQVEVETLQIQTRVGSVGLGRPSLEHAPPDTTTSAMESFASSARLALKMQRVKEKLDSVLEPHRNTSSLGYVTEPDRMDWSQRGRSLVSDSVGLNSCLPPPSLLSPHSKMQVSDSLKGQLISQASMGPHNRGFSPVGRRHRETLSVKLHSSVSDATDPVVPAQHTVVSLYDYTANRSDELTVLRGDVIHVLYKDNDNWWFGRLANGQQGYFPATYVAEEGDEDVSGILEAQAALSEHTELSAERKTPTKVSAAITASGELKFISEQDTDPESAVPKTRKKKKVRKLEVQSQATSSDPEAAGTASSRGSGRLRDRPLPRRPGASTGQANSAFEPDP